MICRLKSGVKTGALGGVGGVVQVGGVVAVAWVGGVGFGGWVFWLSPAVFLGLFCFNKPPTPPGRRAYSSLVKDLPHRR